MIGVQVYENENYVCNVNITSSSVKMGLHSLCYIKVRKRKLSLIRFSDAISIGWPIQTKLARHLDFFSTMVRRSCRQRDRQIQTCAKVFEYFRRLYVQLSWIGPLWKTFFFVIRSFACENFWKLGFWVSTLKDLWLKLIKTDWMALWFIV